MQYLSNLKTKETLSIDVPTCFASQQYWQGLYAFLEFQVIVLDETQDKRLKELRATASKLLDHSLKTAGPMKCAQASGNRPYLARTCAIRLNKYLEPINSAVCKYRVVAPTLWSMCLLPSFRCSLCFIILEIKSSISQFSEEMKMLYSSLRVESLSAGCRQLHA